MRYWCICEEDGYVRFTPNEAEANFARERGDGVEEVVPISRLRGAVDETARLKRAIRNALGDLERGAHVSARVTLRAVLDNLQRAR